MPLPVFFAFDNSYARDLEGLYVPWKAVEVPQRKLVKLNHVLATELGLDVQALDSPEGALMFSGNQLPEGTATIARPMPATSSAAFSPQLGDGRALLLAKSSTSTAGAVTSPSKARAARRFRASATARRRWDRCCASTSSARRCMRWAYRPHARWRR